MNIIDVCVCVCVCDVVAMVEQPLIQTEWEEITIE